MAKPLLLTFLVAFLLSAGATVSLVTRVEPLATAHWPDSERRLTEFLLLLPVAALVCALVRNVGGVFTFGTFAPALLGLAFREASSLVGLFVLLTVLSVGWIVRRGVSQLNLLQVPRAAVMLSVVVVLLVGFVWWSNANERPVAEALPLLPMVIVTGLIERFWTAEEEDGTNPAVWTMVATLLTAFAVFALARLPGLGATLLAYPETLGYVIAAQLLVGRYTGYRLTELRRFRDLAELPEGRP